jgi:hypothetical protein
VSIRAQKEAASGCAKETPEWIIGQLAMLFDTRGMKQDFLCKEGAELVDVIYPEGCFPLNLPQRAKKLEQEIVSVLPEVAAKLATQIMTRHERKARRQIRRNAQTAAREALRILFYLPGGERGSLSSADRRDKATERLRRAGIHMQPETFSKNYQDACIEALGNCLYELIK